VNAADQWIAEHCAPEAVNGPQVRRNVLEACVAALLRERDEAEARVTERLEKQIGQYIERKLRGAKLRGAMATNGIVRDVADDILLGSWRYR
jgi:hypothetical protein